MSHQYLSVDSKFRNRNKFRSPFGFDINIKDSNAFNKDTATDPISDSAPIITWNPNELLHSGTVIHILSKTKFLVKFTSNVKTNLQYYFKKSIEYTSATVPNLKIKNKITYWKFISKTIQNETIIQIEVEELNTSDNTKIYQNAVISILSDSSIQYGYVFLPGNIMLDNKTYILTNDSLFPIESCEIKSFDETTRLANIDTNKSNWTLQHKYSLRLELPEQILEVKNVNTETNTSNTKEEFNVNTINISNEFIGDYGRFIVTDPNSLGNLDVMFKIKLVTMVIEILNDGENEELKEDVIEDRDLLFENGGDKQIRIGTQLSVIERTDYFIQDTTNYNFTNANSYMINDTINLPVDTKNKTWEFMFKSTENNKILVLLTAGYNSSDSNDPFTSFFLHGPRNKIGVNFNGEIAYYSLLTPVIGFSDALASIPSSTDSKTWEIFFRTNHKISLNRNMGFLVIGSTQYNMFYLNYQQSKIGMYNDNNNRIEFTIGNIDNYFDNAYHYFVATLNTTTHTLKIYIDGVLIGSQAFGQASEYAHNSNGIVLGSNISIPDSKETFVGALKNFRIYNREFSGSDILNRYNIFNGNSNTDLFSGYQEINLVSTNLYDNNYHQFIINYNIVNYTYSFYIDNQLQGTISISQNQSTASDTNGLMLGTSPIYNSSSTFLGNMELKNIYIYERILTQTEMDIRYTNRNNDQYVNLTDNKVNQYLYHATLISGVFNKLETHSLVNERTEEKINFNIHYSMLNTQDLNFAPQSGDRCELLKFSRDNEGVILKKVQSTRTSLMRTITFVKLSIPNVELSMQQSIFSYPYLLLKLYNTRYQEKNKLLSNNPNSDNMLFKIPLKFENCTISTYFINISKVGELVNKIKFDLNENFHFEICSPDGNILQLNTEDSVSPHLPIPNIQTSALFKID